jgi:hypothetical protein
MPRRCVQWLGITVFLLTAAPRAGVKLGPIPVYVIDFFLLATYVVATQARPASKGRTPFRGFVLAIAILAVASELIGAAQSPRPQDSIYLIIRTLLAISIFFSASRLIRSEADALFVIKASLLGLLISASLMIATSLPFTRSIASHVFAISFLEPAAERTVERYEETGDPMRGRSLVGVSILTGAFLNSLWPLISLLFHRKATGQFWSRLALTGLIIAPFGIVMSYSRGAILGLFMVVGGTLLFGSGASRRAIIAACLVAIGVFSLVGWDSDYFFFERIERRTEAIFDDPMQDDREYARIYAYLLPFQHLQENPQFLIFGEGNGIQRSGVSFPLHSLFGKAYASYGLVSAISYHILVLAGFIYLLRQMNAHNAGAGFPRLLAQALFAALLGIVPWLAFGHAVVSTPRGATLFFLLFGLVASLRYMNHADVETPASVRSQRPYRAIARGRR